MFEVQEDIEKSRNHHDHTNHHPKGRKAVQEQRQVADEGEATNGYVQKAKQAPNHGHVLLGYSVHGQLGKEQKCR